MEPIDLDGHTMFHDRNDRREVANRISLQIDLNAAAFMVGAAGAETAELEELVFHEPEVRRAMEQVVGAMRRHAYRRQPVRMVPKPGFHCDMCRDSRVKRNPYSGEVFPCPACRG